MKPLTSDEIPEDNIYIVGKAQFTPESDLDGINVIEQYVFDIIQEGIFLTATCPELHLIVSSPDWESLETKINNVYYDKVMEDEKND